MNQHPDEIQPPFPPLMYAKARNPDLDDTDVRFMALKFSDDMVNREVQFRLRYVDPRASRSQVLKGILGDWARFQQKRAEMMLGAESSPFLMEAPIPKLAKPASEYDYVDVRARVDKWIVDVIDRVVQYRCLYLDANTSRNAVINEILNTWANLEWHKSNMTLQGNPCNPLTSDSLGVAHG